MAGDEIVAEWLGDVYADVITTTTSAPQRLSNESLRLRDLRIFNYSGSVSIWFGKYHATLFQSYAHILNPHAAMSFNFVDLYELGCQSYGIGNSYLRILGMNEY